MSVRLVHPPRDSAGGSAPSPSTRFPAAANDDLIDVPDLWFPSTGRHDLIVCAAILLLVAVAVVAALTGPGPLDSWFALWGIAK